MHSVRRLSHSFGFNQFEFFFAFKLPLHVFLLMHKEKLER